MMKRVFLVAFVVFSVFVFAGVSHAKYYLSGYLGLAVPHDSDASDLEGPSITDEITFDPGVALGAKFGNWFGGQNDSYFGLELDFNAHFPSTNQVKGSVGGVSAALDIDADVSVISLSANALLRYPKGSIRPYAGFGLGWFNGEIDDGTISAPGLGSVSFRGDDDNALGWQFLAGLDWLIAPNISLFTEYKYTSADFDIKNEVGLEIKYRVSQIYLGASFHF